MPSDTLLRLLNNAKKSTNKEWSQNNINNYFKELNSFLCKYPKFVTDPTVNLLKAELNKQQLRLNFKQLPLEYPFPAQNVETKIMSIPPPPFYKGDKNFIQFLKTVEQYFLIQKTKAEDKTAILSYLLGDFYVKVENHIIITPDTTISYDALVKACKSILGKPETDTARAKFFEINQTK